MWPMLLSNVLQCIFRKLPLMQDLPWQLCLFECKSCYKKYHVFVNTSLTKRRKSGTGIFVFLPHAASFSIRSLMMFLYGNICVGWCVIKWYHTLVVCYVYILMYSENSFEFLLWSLAINLLRMEATNFDRLYNGVPVHDTIGRIRFPCL